MAKGVPLTDEQKEKMAEGRRRAAEQKKALAEQVESDELRAKAAQAAEDAAQPMERIVTPTIAEDQWAEAQAEYGPFRSYVEVQTPYGLYGLAKGTILHFEPGQAWNYKNKEMQDTMLPVYRKAERIKA